MQPQNYPASDILRRRGDGATGHRTRKGDGMAELIAIQPDAIAVIVRESDGSYHVHTNHHAVGGGAVWGMFWGMP